MILKKGWMYKESLELEWTKKGEIPGLYFLLNDIHAVKWVLKYRLYGPAVNLWPSIYKWAKMISQDLEEICIFQV